MFQEGVLTGSSYVGVKSGAYTGPRPPKKIFFGYGEGETQGAPPKKIFDGGGPAYAPD